MSELRARGRPWHTSVQHLFVRASAIAWVFIDEGPLWLICGRRVALAGRARKPEPDGARLKRGRGRADRLCAQAPSQPGGIDRAHRVGEARDISCGRQSRYARVTRSHTHSAACQELAKTGTNRGDRATRTGRADVPDLDVLDAVER
jgi:hypothetical protein